MGVVSGDFFAPIYFVWVSTFVALVMWLWPRFNPPRVVMLVASVLVTVLFFEHNLESGYFSDDPKGAMEIAIIGSVVMGILYVLFPAVLYVIVGTAAIFLLTTQVKSFGLNYVFAESARNSWYAVALSIGLPLIVGILVVEGFTRVIGQERVRASLYTIVTTDMVVFGARFVILYPKGTEGGGILDLHPGDALPYVVYALSVLIRVVYVISASKCKSGGHAYNPVPS